MKMLAKSSPFSDDMAQLIGIVKARHPERDQLIEHYISRMSAILEGNEDEANSLLERINTVFKGNPLESE